MATLAMETSNCSCEGCIVAWRFTKRQPGGRGDYWVLSLSGNCWKLVALTNEEIKEMCENQFWEDTVRDMGF
jgi:hypothetical protein